MMFDRQRRRRLRVHDRRPPHRLVRGQGRPRPELGRELRRRRRAGRRQHLLQRDRRQGRRVPLHTRDARPHGRGRATRRSRAPASCARTGSTPRRSRGRPTSAQPAARCVVAAVRLGRRRARGRPTARSPAATPIDLTRRRRRADRRRRRRASRRSRLTSRSTSTDRTGMRAALLKGQLMVAAARRAAARSPASPACRSPACSTISTRTRSTTTTLGVTFQGSKPTFRLWAPTAQSATLLDVGCRRRRRPGAPRGDVGCGIRNLVRRGARRAQGRRVPVGGRRLRPDDRRDRDERGDRPLLGRAHDELGALGRDRPRRQGLAPEGVGEDEGAGDRPAGRPRDLRAAHPRLLDHRRDGARGRARHVPGVHARQRGHDAAARSSPTPASTPCTCCRRSTSRRSRRTAPTQAVPDCDLASFGPDSDRAAGVHRRRSSTPTASTGATTRTTTRRPRARTRSTPTAARASREFRSMVGALHGIGLQVVLDEVFNHTAQSGQGEKSVLDQVVPGYYQRLNAAGGVETSTCCQNVATEHEVAEKLMVDSVVTVGARLQGRRLPLRPDGPPLEGEHARGPRRARRAHAQEGRRRRQGDLPLRRGLELRRGREQRALRAGDAGAARRHRHRHVQRPSARRRARRQPGRGRRRSSRASARASAPTRTARRSTARPSRRSPTSLSRPTS